MELQPSCAQPCISSAMIAVGCKYNDQSCGCIPAKQQSIGDFAAACLVQNCPASQLLQIESAGNAGCNAYSLTYMFTNGGSTMGSTTMSLTSSFTSSMTTTPSSIGTVARVTGSTISSPTSIPAATSTSSSTPKPISKLSTASTIGIGVGACAILCAIALAILCCYRHRRANFRQIRRSDSELFALVTPELDTKPMRHELTSRMSRHSMYELPSETNTDESLLREPTPPARVATPPIQERSRSPRIVVHLVEDFKPPESVRKPRKLRKMEGASPLRE